MEDIQIGIIGGSGIYQLDNLTVVEEKEIDTPFGNSSDKYIIGELGGKKVVFLPRHGKGHRILPSELNNRANIYGFKKMGVKYLIGVSAVGSLREEIEPGHIVFPSQIIDRTKGRVSTFFGNGIVAHPAFVNPFCQELTGLFKQAAQSLNIKCHDQKTYVCMEGPVFSTKAESQFHRMIGGDIIGMTAIPEAKLAREAEMCYGLIALSTDYDCWREDEEAVNVEMVLETMRQNGENTKRILSHVIPHLSLSDCECHKAIEFSIMTDKKLWPDETKKNLHEIIKKYL